MDFSLVIMIVVIAFLAVLMVLGTLRRKKFNEQLLELRDNLKVGDRVMTDTGVVGELVSKRTVGEFTFLTLKTGDGNNVGYLEVHINAVYYAFDENGNPLYAGQKQVEVDENVADTEEVSEEKTDKKETKTTKSEEK